MRPQRHVDAAVVHTEIGMMRLVLGERGHLVDERHRGQEVDEFEAPVQTRLSRFGRDGPAGNLTQQKPRGAVVERRRAALARYATSVLQAHSRLPLNASRAFGTLSIRD